MTCRWRQRLPWFAAAAAGILACWPRQADTTPRCWAPRRTSSNDLGPLPDEVTVHPDAGYGSQETRDELAARDMTGEIARKGSKAPVQAGQRWHAERTSPWHNGFSRLQRCYERHEEVIEAFFDLADTIITVRSLTRQAWVTYRPDTRPQHRR